MKRCIAVCLVLICNLLNAQVQFEARVSKTTLGLNERLRIDFMMNVDGDNFVPPSFAGFRIIAGPSQQISQSWINGKSSFEKAYSYYLVPNQKGTFVLKGAAIEFNGATYKTAPVKITVTEATEEPRDPNNSEINADENLYLIADVSKGNPYVNEPTTVVYKLYFANIGISNFKELNKPKYNDFWSQNIEIKQLVAEEGIFKGQNYRYIVLKKVVLYPQKSGRLKIEPLSLEIDVQLPSNRRDMYGRMVLTETTKKVSAGAKIINVKSLPEAGKPDDFSGAVGSFEFKVTPSKTTLKHDESLDLVVSVSGKGNLKLFSLPKPVVPNALEMYEAVHSEQVNTPLSGMAGKIADRYTIVPQYKGSYPVKPIKFTYFDLDTKSYKTLSSPEIIINVVDGPSPNEATVASSNKNKGDKVEQFKFINVKSKLLSMDTKDFFESNLFFGLFFFPFLMLPLIVLFKKKKEAIDGDVTGNRIRMNNKLAKKYLSEARKQINNKELFYIALEKAMHNFLKAKLNIETSEMSKDNIQEVLLSRNANPEAVNDFIALTENCEIARYAPASSVTIQHDFDKAVAIISNLEKQIV